MYKICAKTSFKEVFSCALISLPVCTRTAQRENCMMYVCTAKKNRGNIATDVFDILSNSLCLCRVINSFDYGVCRQSTSDPYFQLFPASRLLSVLAVLFVLGRIRVLNSNHHLHHPLGVHPVSKFNHSLFMLSEIWSSGVCWRRTLLITLLITDTNDVTSVCMYIIITNLIIIIIISIISSSWCQ